MGYRFLEHKSDQYVEVWGKNLEELFSSAAEAFFETITDTKKIDEVKVMSFEVNGESVGDLLYNFLNKLLFIFDTKKFVGKSFEISFSGRKIFVRMRGDTFDPKKHEVRFEIKGVTLHNFMVKKNSRWEAKFLLDL